MRHRTSLFLLAATLSLATPALADPEAAPASSRSAWYGHETALVAVAGFAIFAGGAMSDLPALAALGAATYVGGPALLHGVKNNGGAAAGSLLLHIGLPVGLTVGGALITSVDCHGDYCGYSGAIIGGITGLVAAPVIDALFLAWEDEPVLQVSTAVAPTEGGAFGSFTVRF